MTRPIPGPLRRERIGRILVRAPNWIGDAVMAIPVIRGLHRSFPAARITVLSRPGVPSVFAGLPGVDQLMTDDPAGAHHGIRGRLRLAAEVRRGGFDLAVLLPNAFSPALVTALAGVPRRLGYRTDGRSALLTHRVSPPPARPPIHQIDAYRGILTGAGLTPDPQDPAIALSLAERVAARTILTGFGIDPAKPLVGVNPGAAFGGAKRWPADRFAAVCRSISQETGARVLILGGPAETALGDALADQSGDGAINLCGKTPLRDAMALIHQCGLFLTNDSGPMHLAAALDVPLVAVFGPTNHRTTSPAGPFSRVVRAPDIPCAPCMKRECPTDHRCMTAVTPEAVLAEARDILGRRRP